jgi:mannose/fructose/N-acetylgalactosamine-specific phosphotransferase system component IIB
MIAMLRIDGRLIHGQVIAGFTRRLGANMIVVINDAAAKNAFQKNMMKMAIPAGITLEVLALDDACQRLSASELDSKKILILLKSPVDFLALLEKGFKIEKINVGGVINEGAAIKLTKEVMATPQELDAWKKINTMGIKMELQWESYANINDFNNVISKA